MDDWCLLFLNSVCLLLAMGDYTKRPTICQFETISCQHYTCGIYFQRNFYKFLSRFTSVKTDGAVVCLLFAVNMARSGNTNTNEFTYFLYYIQNEMLCYVRILNIQCIIVFSLRSSSPIVLYGEVYCPSTLAMALYLTRRHYGKTVPSGEDKNIII